MGEVTLVENPFRSVTENQPRNAVAEAATHREIAEVQAAMVIAQRFPRDPIKACDRIVEECARPALAKLNKEGVPAALYAYPRGNTVVEGPSIRLAEVLARNWGNISCGIRELSREGHSSTVEAFCWDLETNTRSVMVFSVPHVRQTRNSRTMLEDPRDIYEMISNMGARRLRACILRIIPQDVTDTAIAQVNKTLATNLEITPERIKTMLETFASLKVTREMIEKRIGVRVNDVTAAQFLQLGKIASSIRDGFSGAADWFEVSPAKTEASGTEALREELEQTSQNIRQHAADRQNAARQNAAAEPVPEEPATEEPATTEPDDIDDVEVPGIRFDYAISIWDKALVGEGAVAEARRLQILQVVFGENYETVEQLMTRHSEGDLAFGENAVDYLASQVRAGIPASMNSDARILGWLRTRFNVFKKDSGA